MTYVAVIYDFNSNAENGPALKLTGAPAVSELVGSPASLVSVGALVAWVIRLLVLYDPKKRKRWGRYVRETSVARTLLWAYWGMEAVIWMVASAYGINR